jgi:enoyl-CoA hydratase/carnithine racemase
LTNQSFPEIIQSVDYEHIEHQISDGVGHLTLARPEKMNTLGIGPGSSRDEIARALTAADTSEDVGCHLITAQGRAFCAGGDLTGAPKTEHILDEHLFVQQVDAFHAEIRGLRKPVVAGIQGLCLGTGLGFMAQFDIVIAGDDARFGLIEGRIGHPGGSEIVPLVGAAWAKFMILTGELLEAERAAEIGLVLTTVPKDELADRVFDLARRIASLPREGTLLNKAAIERTMEASGRAAGRLIGRTHDAMTKAMASEALAPDGRRFEDILADEGVEGIKQARNQQFQGSWLAHRASRREKE